MEEEFGPSIATLARGSIEALGRGWWLMQSRDALQLEHRAAATRRDEIAEATPPRRQPRTNRWRSLIPTHWLPQKMRCCCSSRGGHRASAPAGPRLAWHVLDAAGNPSGERQYSRLSGSAHGELTTIVAHAVARNVDGAMGNYNTGLPIGLANDYIHAVVEVLDQHVRWHIDSWDSPSERDRWSASMYRATDSLSKDLRRPSKHIRIPNRMHLDSRSRPLLLFSTFALSCRACALSNLPQSPSVSAGGWKATLGRQARQDRASRPHTVRLRIRRRRIPNIHL